MSRAPNGGVVRGIIQVAGILDLQEARLVVDAGADRLGFPLRLTCHQEDIPADRVARIVESLPPGIGSVVITYLNTAVEILNLCEITGATAVQLHGHIGMAELIRLRFAAPHLLIIKSLVIGISNESKLIQTIAEMNFYVDAFITDTYDPETGACGATGKTHDWQVSRRLVQYSPKPVILAGGLNPDNVARAILEVRPAGVDVHTGVEGEDGRKDFYLLRSFVTRARKAFSYVAEGHSNAPSLSPRSTNPHLHCQYHQA